jgi:hypothetical protein
VEGVTRKSGYRQYDLTDILATLEIGMGFRRFFQRERGADVGSDPSLLDSAE